MNDNSSDSGFMQRALELARRAQAEGEVPVGAVLVLDGAVLAEGWNRPIAAHDPTAHAEIVTLRAGATRLKNYRLPNTTLYVTLEPCAMCAGAIVQARVGRVVYGASDPQAGAAGSVYNVLQSEALNHRAVVTRGVLAEACAEQLRTFFRERRGA